MSAGIHKLNQAHLKESQEASGAKVPTSMAVWTMMHQSLYKCIEQSFKAELDMAKQHADEQCDGGSWPELQLDGGWLMARNSNWGWVACVAVGEKFPRGLLVALPMYTKIVTDYESSTLRIARHKSSSQQMEISGVRAGAAEIHEDGNKAQHVVIDGDSTSASELATWCLKWGGELKHCFGHRVINIEKVIVKMFDGKSDFKWKGQCKCDAYGTCPPLLKADGTPCKDRRLCVTADKGAATLASKIRRSLMTSAKKHFTPESCATAELLNEQLKTWPGVVEQECLLRYTSQKGEKEWHNHKESATRRIDCGAQVWGNTLCQRAHGCFGHCVNSLCS